MFENNIEELRFYVQCLFERSIKEAFDNNAKHQFLESVKLYIEELNLQLCRQV
jgi:hypothetical protein